MLSILGFFLQTDGVDFDDYSIENHTFTLYFVTMMWQPALYIHVGKGRLLSKIRNLKPGVACFRTEVLKHTNKTLLKQIVEALVADN